MNDCGPADERDAARQLPGHLPSGIDIGRGQADAQRTYNERVSTAQTLRTRDQVSRFFTGLDLVEPGLVQVHQWRPDPDDFALKGTVSARGAVGRKPGA